jgi:hypothetical protein
MIARDTLVICEHECTTGVYYYAGRVAVPFSAGAIVEMKQGGHMCFSYQRMREATEEECKRIEYEWRNQVGPIDHDMLDKLRSEINGVR